MVLDSLLDGKSGPLVHFKIQITGVGAEGFGVNDGEVDLALVFLGNGLEGLSQFSALLGCFGENVGKRKASLYRYQH